MFEASLLPSSLPVDAVFGGVVLNLWCVIEQAAPNLKCWSAQHTQLLVCAGVGLPAAILLPVGMAFTLLRNLRRDTLYTESTLQRFGFLYRNYDAEFLYWESVYMGKVLVLVAIQVRTRSACAWGAIVWSHLCSARRKCAANCLPESIWHI